MSANDQNPKQGEGFAFDPEDPRLTAYVLGALEGEERLAIEDLLDRDPEARAFVEGLTAAAEALDAEYADAGGEALLAGQRAKALTPPAPEPVPLSLARKVAGWSMLAAAGIAIVGAAVFFGDGFQGTSRSANPQGERQSWTHEARSPSAGRAGTLAEVDLEFLRQGGYLAPEGTKLLGQLGYVGEFLVAGEGYVDRSKSMDPATSLLLGGDDGRGRVTHVFRAVDAKPDWSVVEKLWESWKYDGEQYAQVPENPFRRTSEEARSTFSIDVDTAAYANIRRYLMQYGQLPPPNLVRVEECINYFTYDYPEPDDGMPFSVTTEVARCPWEPAHRLVMVGIQGKSIHRDERKSANLVFLVDVSGSMNAPNKLPLLQSSLKLLVEQMRPADRIAIVVYAGSSGLVLPSTSGDQKGRIVTALERLSAGGSTNGGAGIELAYRVAQEEFIDNGVNRVILCTDGDFNVGTTSQDDLTRLIEKKRQSGVFLSVLGFGAGNIQDDKMELLADKGNGNYAFIDTMAEARKVLVEQMSGTLEVIAKDVKIQVEFNPATVGAWRLIGYENRILDHQDFNDDKKDAGDVGAGATVTALYQVAPVGAAWSGPGVDDSRYTPPPAQGASHLDELMFLRLRYKDPDGEVSQLLETPVRPSDAEFRGASRDLRFAGSVAGFALLLKKSAYAGNLTADQVRLYAQEAVGEDRAGYRREFLTLVEQARSLLTGQ